MRLIGCDTIYGADGEHATPYLTRIWIGRLRLHIFHRGDADPDCHDHPWDFWTFPLTSYVEEVVDWSPERRFLLDRVVKAFRLHFRPAEHTHRVLGRYRGWYRGGVPDLMPIAETGKIITLVWQGRERRKWGFLRNRDGNWCWTPWKEYVFGGGKHAPCGPWGGSR